MMIYKKFKIHINKITSKTSPYISKDEKPRYISNIGTRWVGTYRTKRSALKAAKAVIDKNKNLHKYKGYK